MKELQQSLKSFVKADETLKVQTKVFCLFFILLSRYINTERRLKMLYNTKPNFSTNYKVLSKKTKHLSRVEYNCKIIFLKTKIPKVLTFLKLNFENI